MSDGVLQIDGRRRRHPSMSAVVALLLMLQLNCAAADRCRAIPLTGALVQIDHILADEGAYAWSLQIYPDGELTLRKGFKRPSCRVADIDELRGALAKLGLLPPGLTHVPHGELVQVRYMGTNEIYDLSVVPPALRQVLERVDDAFTSAFGNAYDWPLIER